MRRTLEQAGFRVVDWKDRSEAGISWSAEQRRARAAAQATGGASPPLGLHIAMGPDFPRLSANLGRNLSERRVGLIQAVLATRPSSRALICSAR